MNRSERRARERELAKSAAALQKRSEPVGGPKEVVDASRYLFRQGKAKDALPGLSKAVAAYPNDADVRGALAYALASTGEFDAAIEQYQRLLELQPYAVPVLTNLATLLASQGRADEARRHLERAAALAPEHANTAFVLAELLAKQDRKGEAFHHYVRAVELFEKKIGQRPGIEHCDDLVKLAAAMAWTGDLEGALRSLDQAVELRPDHALAHARRGVTFMRLRRNAEAIESLKRAAAAVPTFAAVQRILGKALLGSGDADAARGHLQTAVHLDPTDEMARYFLAAARQESPDAPPPTYVEKLFDEYAQSFDSHLINVLQYRSPELVCGAVLGIAGAQAAEWSVIDLGCGTGLCGPLVRHAARSLIGVDISEGMLAKAREKTVYDELRLGDVALVLSEYSDAFDVALCADVMVYLGSLTPIFAAAARALKRGGLFAFTTEIHPGEGFALNTSGRYRYSKRYIEVEAASHGFAVVHFEPVVARYENYKPDVHNLFIVRRELAAPDDRSIEI